MEAYGLEIMAVSHDRFQARWYLSPEKLEEGQRMASGDPARCHLVLRVFSLTAGAPEEALSSRWQDFAVEGVVASRYFVLPYPADRVRAVLGLTNESGRFSPLLRSGVVALPAPPLPPDFEPEKAAADEPVPAEEAHGDAGAARLERLAGLPDELRTIPKSPIGDKIAKGSFLDEAAVLAAVHGALASDPDPHIPAQPEPVAAAAVSAGASEQLASQWEELWSEGAPIEVRAELIVTGRLGAGMKLLLGHEEVTSAPGGFFHWRRKLDDFGQAWPLLQAGLSVPSVPAEPALRFFREAGESAPLLELQATLEIEGRITDPGYGGRLPEGLRPDAHGIFKVTRALPHGAVILPGLSLVAAS